MFVDFGWTCLNPKLLELYNDHPSEFFHIYSLSIVVSLMLDDSFNALRSVCDEF